MLIATTLLTNRQEKTTEAPKFEIRVYVQLYYSASRTNPHFFTREKTRQLKTETLNYFISDFQTDILVHLHI